MPQANAYGTTSPRALEPNPIETTLAQLASAGSSANAQNMLDTYQAQRQQAEGEYSLDLENQHQYAKQQLMATMQDNAAKSAAAFLKEPGGLEFANANPQFNYLTAGTDPAAMQAIMGQRTRLQNADVLSKVGTGAAALSTAGTPLSADQVSQAAGIPGIQQGVAMPLQVAQEKTRGMLGAAGISAASRTANANKGSTVTTYGPLGEPVSIAVTQKNVTGAPTPMTRLQPQNPNTAGLTMAQPDTGPAALPNTQVPATPASTQAPQINANNFHTMKGTPAYNDIVAGAVAHTDGSMTVKKDRATGRMVGKSGQVY